MVDGWLGIWLIGVALCRYLFLLYSNFAANHVVCQRIQLLQKTGAATYAISIIMIIDVIPNANR